MTKKNFPFVDLFEFHAGRDGGNVIDQKAVAAKGIELFSQVSSGHVKVKKISGNQVIEDGAKRQVEVTILMELS